MHSRALAIGECARRHETATDHRFRIANEGILHRQPKTDCERHDCRPKHSLNCNPNPKQKLFISGGDSRRSQSATGDCARQHTKRQPNPGKRYLTGSITTGRRPGEYIRGSRDNGTTTSAMAGKRYVAAG